jgi:hypothetical protein
MLSSYRKSFFTLFAVFFILSLPFLLIFSLGYQLNLESESVEYSLTVQLETVPRNAEIKSHSSSYKTPLEIRIKEDTLTEINLKLKDFYPENFVFSSLRDNSALRIRDLWLLPENPFLEFNLDNFSFVNFLSQDYVLLKNKQNNQLAIQNIGFRGFQSSPESIDLENTKNLSTNKFEVLLGDIFWHPEAKVLIYKDFTNNGWQNFNLNSLPFQVVSVAGLSNTQVLLLDNQQSVWALDLENRDFTFIDSNVNALSFTQNPDSIWILKNDSIYRIQREEGNRKVSLNNLNLTRTKYTKQSLLGKQTESDKVFNYQDFTVRNLFLGFSFEIGNSLFYVDDSNKSNIRLITDKAIKTGASSNTLFWLDENMNLNSYNLLYQRYRQLGNLGKLLNKEDVDTYRIFYYKGWNRIMIYTPSTTISYWFDTFSLNSNLVSQTPINWIQEKNCFQEVIKNYQFCFTPEKGYFYRNDTLFK